jgi:hypothetical protein
MHNYSSTEGIVVDAIATDLLFKNPKIFRTFAGDWTIGCVENGLDSGDVGDVGEAVEPFCEFAADMYSNAFSCINKISCFLREAVTFRLSIHSSRIFGSNIGCDYVHFIRKQNIRNPGFQIA